MLLNDLQMIKGKERFSLKWKENFSVNLKDRIYFELLYLEFMREVSRIHAQFWKLSR